MLIGNNICTTLYILLADLAISLAKSKHNSVFYFTHYLGLHIRENNITVVYIANTENICYLNMFTYY